MCHSFRTLPTCRTLLIGRTSGAARHPSLSHLCNSISVPNSAPAGARRILAPASHGLFTNPAIARLEASDIDETLVTDKVYVNVTLLASARVKIVSVAKMLASAILDTN